MILNYTNISCRDVLRGLWFSTKFSCDFFDFLLRALRLAYENQLRKLMYLPECLFCTAGKSESRKAENKENRARGMGRRLHPAPLCCHKKRIEVSLDALLRCLLFVMFPTAVFFHNPASALFFADFPQRRNPLRFGNSVCCSERSLRCGKSLRPGCVVYLTVRIALRDRSV